MPVAKSLLLKPILTPLLQYQIAPMQVVRFTLGIAGLDTLTVSHFRSEKHKRVKTSSGPLPGFSGWGEMNLGGHFSGHKKLGRHKKTWGAPLQMPPHGYGSEHLST